MEMSLYPGHNTAQVKRVLWWGRFDPDYSRNRILRSCLTESGWSINDFRPRWSAFGDIEAIWRLKKLPRPDLVWVPCFRQRDIAAAARWARCHQVPLIIDPLISSYDKQVYERDKLAPHSRAAKRLLTRESRLFQRADCVLADTRAHADYFHDTLGVPCGRLHVVPVGAEESLFRPGPPPPVSQPLEVLFFGSFIPLQGLRVIVEAAARCQNLPIRWSLLGRGPLLAECRNLASGLSNVTFEDWIPYEQLPARIHKAAIVLGIFGTTPKARRVIPNKVYQGLACGRPVITLESPAYPDDVAGAAESGMRWVPPGDSEALAAAVFELASHPENLAHLAACAQSTYKCLFSSEKVCADLTAALHEIL